MPPSVHACLDLHTDRALMCGYPAIRTVPGPGDRLTHLDRATGRTVPARASSTRPSATRAYLGPRRWGRSGIECLRGAAG